MNSLTPLPGGETEAEREARLERSRTLAAQPDTLECLLRMVIQGKSRREISEVWGISYEQLAGLVAGIKDGRERLADAEKDVLFVKLREIAASVPTDSPRYGDVLKAIELLGKNLSLFTEKHEVQATHNITGLTDASLADLKLLIQGKA